MQSEPAIAAADHPRRALRRRLPGSALHRPAARRQSAGSAAAGIPWRSGCRRARAPGIGTKWPFSAPPVSIHRIADLASSLSAATSSPAIGAGRSRPRPRPPSGRHGGRSGASPSEAGNAVAQQAAGSRRFSKAEPARPARPAAARRLSLAGHIPRSTILCWLGSSKALA